MSKPDFCATYGIADPIVLAGMAMISEPELVAAVSAAGGLGVLGTGPMPPPLLREHIAAVRSLTDRPFGVNQIVEETALGPLTTEADLEVIVMEKVSPVVFFWNPPPPTWLERLRQAGLRVWQTVNSPNAARTAIDSGIDALMVQGREAGGHNRSSASLHELLESIAGITSEHHVIAAGGIADAASAAAAIACGADAVCLGTRFVASVESPAHPEWKRRIVSAAAADTTITRVFGPEWPDAPMRVLRNRATARAESDHAQQPVTHPVGKTVLFGQEYAMPSASAVLPTVATRGDLEEMCLAAGTSVGAVGAIMTVREIMDEIRRGLVRR